MSSVPRVSLGDLSTLVTKGTTPTSIGADFTYDGIPFLRINNLSSNGIDFSDILYINNEVHKTLLKRSVINSGDFLITIAGTIGKVLIVPPNSPEMNCNQAIAILRLTKEVDKQYLKHWLSTSDAFRQIQGAKVTATISNLSLTQIKNLSIPLPPLPEQKRIAAILDKADAIRRKRQQAIELANEFLRSVFLDMFGDPVVNPKGWEVQSCSEICRQITVGLVIKPASYYVDVGVPAIRSLNITTKGIKQKNFVYFSQEDNVGALSKSRVYEGDIVVVRSGQPGKAAVIPRDLDGINAIDVLIVRPKQEAILSEFLAFFINSSAGKNLVMKEERGQIQKHLNVGSLNQAEIPVPPIDLQEKFVSILNTVKRLETSPSKIESENFFNSLSQMAFSGNL